MEVLNNRNYILEQIKEYSDIEIAGLRKEHEKRIAKLRKERSSSLNKELEELDSKQQKELERIEKQTLSNFEIKTSRTFLSKRSSLYQEVIANLRKALMKGNKTLIQNMIKTLEKNSTKKIKGFRIPKGTGLKKYDESLTDIRVIAVIGPDEELEITLDDILRVKQKEIQDIIEKNFFK